MAVPKASKAPAPSSPRIWLATGKQMAAIIRNMLRQPRSAFMTFEKWAAPLLAQMGDTTDSACSLEARLSLFERCMVQVKLQCGRRQTSARSGIICTSEDGDMPIGFITLADRAMTMNNVTTMTGTCSLHGLYGMWAHESRMVTLVDSDRRPTHRAYLTVIP
ncbi:hypothetical protein DL89DRAFT_265199 [Linderina pennispora]|uniref:Uncharacterized protein n=1 Tax=Linderina pennispora TaxID=61395 RepID=A0A1Y1WHJ6_9FUNG|nr:uncharacterized protein DL89DRAFT_265199 [Linderina pennispora]ORX73041.1 hypothetical protein DL89DRAFT_265199 [Linderina pennispora]